jgi:DNA-binding NtrC family response regulator
VDEEASVRPERSSAGDETSLGLGADESPATRQALVGKSLAIEQLRELIERVGPTDSTVLISGESGTGKALVARELWARSPRRDRPFITIDCGSLVSTLFESELFGHVRGAFTGATTTKHGWLELANGGSVFFDEIANISPEIQGKLLRVIQDRAFSRVGSTQLMSVDVRIIAATNKDLLEEIRQRRFREDLYYRLCVVPLACPPLRRHREDIPLLAHHFLRIYSARLGRKTAGFSPEALDLLARYDWPGNVRELENVIERAVVMANGPLLTPAEFLRHGPGLPAASPAVGTEPEKSLADVEREHIRSVLLFCGGSRREACARLGIDRKTLWRKMKKYGLPARGRG